MINLGGFGDEAIAAFIVFILGIIFTVVWQRYTEKRRRLVYKIEANKIVLDTNDEIKNRIAILFDDQPVQELFAYRVTLENIGNLAVRQQQILFQFPERTELVTSPNFKHEPLVGPIETVQSSATPLQLIYRIGQIDKNKKIEFQFFSKGNQEANLQVFGTNAIDTETEIIEQSNQKIITRAEHFQRLILILLLFLVIPPLLKLLITIFEGGISERAFFLRQLVEGIQGLILLLTYPSLRVILSDFFLNKSSQKSEVQISSIQSSQVLIQTDGSNINEVEIRSVPEQ